MASPKYNFLVSIALTCYIKVTVFLFQYSVGPQMATISPPANVSSLVSRFEPRPESRPESRPELRPESRSDDPKYGAARFRSKKVRPPLIRLEFVTAQPEPKPVQARLKMFESSRSSEFENPSRQLPFRKNESGNNVRSRTTLERPLLKLKSRFEKNNSVSPMRKNLQGSLSDPTGYRVSNLSR